MAMFNSYVCLPEGIYIYIYGHQGIFFPTATAAGIQNQSLVDRTESVIVVPE